MALSERRIDRALNFSALWGSLIPQAQRLCGINRVLRGGLHFDSIGQVPICHCCDPMKSIAVGTVRAVVCGLLDSDVSLGGTCTRRDGRIGVLRAAAIGSALAHACVDVAESCGVSGDVMHDAMVSVCGDRHEESRCSLR